MTAKFTASPRTVEPTPAAPVDRLARVNEVLELLVAGLRDAYELGERERAIAQQLLFGRNSYAIAGQLGLDERSVLYQIQDLLAKTNTDGREGLMRLALRVAGERERADAPVRRMCALASPSPSRGPEPLVSRSTARSRHAGAWPAASTQRS